MTLTSTIYNDTPHHPHKQQDAPKAKPGPLPSNPTSLYSSAQDHVCTTIAVPAFMARLRAHFLQGKLCDTILRCAVPPEPEEQEQSSSSKKRKATSTEAPCRPLRSSSSSSSGNQQQQPPQQPQYAGKGKAKQGGGAATLAPPQAHTTDILCHAVVLCARSPYFEASLSGEWNEAQTKTVEVELENE